MIDVKDTIIVEDERPEDLLGSKLRVAHLLEFNLDLFIRVQSVPCARDDNRIVLEYVIPRLSFTVGTYCCFGGNCWLGDLQNLIKWVERSPWKVVRDEFINIK